MDQLAESYLSTSPYAYVANNPVSQFDVDGRWFNQDGTIDTSGRTPGFTSGGAMATQFYGSNAWESTGSGDISALVAKAASLGGTWSNTGSGFTDSNNILLGYDGRYKSLNTDYAEGGIGAKYINIPSVELSGRMSLVFGLQLRSHVNAYMKEWNAQHNFNFLVNRVGDQVLPAKESSFGKLWSVISPRIWTDGGLSYSVNSEGIATSIMPITGDVPVSGPGIAGVKGILQAEAKIAGRGLLYEPISLTTSSKSLAPARTYTIYNEYDEVLKFGVTDANLVRYNKSLKNAGPGAYGKFSDIMPKNQAHISEKYSRSLYYNSTGQWDLLFMKVPHPVDFNTLQKIKKP